MLGHEDGDLKLAGATAAAPPEAEVLNVRKIVVLNYFNGFYKQFNNDLEIEIKENFNIYFLWIPQL
jgi:hypothetical protein